MLDAKTKYHINPTGRFVIGDPWRRWLDRRKIIVDTYGGYSRTARRFLRQGSLEGGSLGLLHGVTSQRTLWPRAWRERRKCN